MDFRKQKEKQFHDDLRREVFEQRWAPALEKMIAQNPLWANMKYYSVERKSRTMVLNWLLKNSQNKRVLDYCCGNGEDALYLAKNGAQHVTGIDISEISVTNCKTRASADSVQNKTQFLVMDAEAMDFAEDSFDIITEYGALHHLKLKDAYAELARVIKPDGMVICNEALGHNPLIQVYRKATPHLRTEWEVQHILRKEDLSLAKEYFRKVEMHFFHLLTLAVVPFRKGRHLDVLLRWMERIDGFLLKLPILKWQAWQIVFILSEPIKKTTGDRGLTTAVHPIHTYR